MDDDDDRREAQADYEDSEAAYDRYEFEQLVASAKAGSLVAGRDLLSRAIRYTMTVLCQQRDDDHRHIRQWMIELLWDIQKCSDKPVEQLISPPTGGNRPKGNALEDDWIRRDLHARVHDLRNAGMSTKVVFDEVAVQISANGYRNSKGEPLSGSMVRKWFYQECKCGNEPDF